MTDSIGEPYDTDIFTMPRLVSTEIIPWEYPQMDGEPTVIGEAIRIKAQGSYIYKNAVFPISIHATVPAGHPAVPIFGDVMSVRLEKPRHADVPDGYVTDH